MGLRIEHLTRPSKVKRAKKRRGRGIGSGLGKTSGRGHKGAKSRSGGGVYNPGFEGGQMPLVRRLPKRGFTNKFKKEWEIVNISSLQKIAPQGEGKVIDKAFLIEKRIIKKKALPVKILGKGKLTKAVTVKANAFSKGALEAIKEAGGKAETI